jgi:hypothetical protein
LFYGTMCMRRDGAAGLRRFASDFLPFLALSSGLALHNGLAVLEGWSGHQSPFIRTPKVGQDGVAYQLGGAGPLVLGELALAAWGLLGLVGAVQHGQLVLSVFLTTQVVGCAAVALGGRT